jgi:exodeoxyribonuclease VII large subunit
MVRARIGLYEPRGEFQVIIEHMEEAGAGLLQRQFDELKASLAAKGLFDTEHKKALPKLPTSIGVITSPTGAAIRDILQVLERRAPQIPVYIYPVAVQGKKAAKEIESAILRANKDKKCDLLIVGRGGGSLEDLWSFNERNVATAIFDSEIPVISAVGHEVDTTIADYVADVRAATPSVAAELAVPDMQELRIKATNLNRRLTTAMQRYLQQRNQTLQLRLQQLSNQRPAYRLQQQKQKLDELDMRGQRAIRLWLERQGTRVEQLTTRLNANSPQTLLNNRKQKVESLEQRLMQQMQRSMEQQGSQLALLAARLNSVSPLNTLQRGYSITQDSKTGVVIQQTEQAKIGQTIQVRLQDGQIDAEVTAKHAN